MESDQNSIVKAIVKDEYDAREIMGNNFFGVDEAIKYLNIDPTKYQLEDLREVPFKITTLQQFKETHILVAIFPISIIEIRYMVKGSLFFSHKDAWYNQKDFAAYTSYKASWFLIRKTPISDSTLKTWREQQKLLAQNEIVPTARIVTYAIIAHYLATAERLFDTTKVRCVDMPSFDCRPTISFPSGGLCIQRDYSETQSYDNVGLITMQKPDTLKS